MQKPTLDIVLPCYNPLGDWHKNIISEFLAIQQRLPSLELNLIIVNDGSSVNVEAHHVKELKENIPALQFISLKSNSGKGAAVRKGVSVSTADYCIYTDIDFPYTTESLIKVYTVLQSEIDIAIGVRDDNYYNQVPTARVFISKTLKSLIYGLMSIGIKDTQCGLKGFNNKGKEILLNTSINRYLYDMEFIKLASRNKNIKLKATEVSLKEGVVFSKMPLSILLGEFGNFIKVLFK